MSSSSRRTSSSRRPGACSAAFAWRCARRSEVIPISPEPRPWSRREKQSTRIRTIPICRRCAGNTGSISSIIAAIVSPVSKRVPCICLWRNCRPPQTARPFGRNTNLLLNISVSVNTGLFFSGVPRQRFPLKCNFCTLNLHFGRAGFLSGECDKNGFCVHSSLGKSGSQRNVSSRPRSFLTAIRLYHSRHFHRLAR